MKFQEPIQKVLTDPGKYHPEDDESVGFEVEQDRELLRMRGHGIDGGERALEPLELRDSDLARCEE